LGVAKLLENESESDGETDSGEKNGKTKIERLFILPGDIPAVSPRTIRLVGECVQTSTPTKSGAGFEVAVPTYEGLGGHPLCMNRSCIETVMHFEGDGGIKAALASANWTKLETMDRAVLLDADTPSAFEELQAYVRKTKGISTSIVNELLYYYETFPHIRDHCRAVGQMSARMCAHLNMLGYALDTELARSAAALHDMNRLHVVHSREAARNLRARGYMAVADAVSLHDGFFGIYPKTFTESAIICTADKLLKETTLVPLKKRYEKVLAKWTEESKVGRRIKMDRDICQAVVDRYEKITGDLIYT
jgi:HD superfamily phosphodiesterase